MHLLSERHHPEKVNSISWSGKFIGVQYVHKVWCIDENALVYDILFFKKKDGSKIINLCSSG